MRIYPVEVVEREFERRASDTVSATHGELRQGHFANYDEFEHHQLTKRKPIWVDALMGVSNCIRRDIPEEQYDLFGRVFREFYFDHIEWLEDPSICPTHVKQACEEKLKEIIESFNRNKKCHWRRDHEFVCFCSATKEWD